MFGVTEEVKIGVKSQIVIPARIRSNARVTPGDVLIMTGDSSGRISLMKKPDDWAHAAWGCCKGAWGEKPSEYISQERKTWK